MQKKKVWMAFGILLVAISVVIIILSYLLASFFKYKRLKLLNTLWYFFGTMLNQGGSLGLLNNTILRIVVGFWLLIDIVFVASYGGCILSKLAIPEMEPVVDTIEKLDQMLKQEAYKVGARKDGSTLSIFINATTEGIIKDVGKSIFKYSDYCIVGSMREGMGKVLLSNFAFIGIKNLLLLQSCYFGRHKFLQAKDSYLSDNIAVAMQKGFPFKQSVDKVVRRIFESGIAAHFFEMQLMEMDTKETEEVDEINAGDPLRLNEVNGLFIVLVIGYAMSILCLIFEFLFVRLRYIK